MAPSQYLKPPQAPPIFTATPEALAADTKRLLQKSKKLQDDIVTNVKPESATFHNVVLPMAQDDNIMSLESQIIGFYQAVSTDANLRNASTDAEKEMDDFSKIVSETGMNDESGVSRRAHSSRAQGR